jgi:hypothetical protein
MHWYSYNPHDGSIESRYDADLKQARKEKLFISITTVDKEIRSNWAINDYLQRQTVKACIENEIWPNEDYDDYLSRIKIEAGKHSRQAATKGDCIHKIFEDFPQMPIDPDYLGYYDLACSYFDNNILHTRHREIMLADPRIGVAGRMDFIGEHREYGPVILDYKTQEFKHKDKAKQGPRKAGYYNSWVRQLAAGRYFYWLKTGEWLKCLSLAIDSKEAGLYEEYLWSDEEVEAGYREFMCHCFLYFTEKKYWPAGRWNIEFKI